MTLFDLGYVTSLLDEGWILGPVLELGAAYGGLTCRDLIGSAGLEYKATDVLEGRGVDYVANFESGEGVDLIRNQALFGTSLVLNVLEHTFEPAAVLDHVLEVTKPGGTIVVVSPVVWPIHDYPKDFLRLLPDWYSNYAVSRRLNLIDDTFQYVGVGRVTAFRNADGQKCFPPAAHQRPLYRLYSRSIHRLFNSFGRMTEFSSKLAIGAAFQKQSA